MGSDMERRLALAPRAGSQVAAPSGRYGTVTGHLPRQRNVPLQTAGRTSESAAWPGPQSISPAFSDYSQSHQSSLQLVANQSHHLVQFSVGTVSPLLLSSVFSWYSQPVPYYFVQFSVFSWYSRSVPVRLQSSVGTQSTSCLHSLA